MQYVATRMERAPSGFIAAGRAGLLLASLLLMAAVCVWAGFAHAATAKIASEASGDDFYKRGYYPEALAEWKKAVETQHDAGAAFRLGEEYFDAKVVQRDVPTAIKYYEIGAKGGDARAQMDLGSMYDKGWGVSRDATKAAKWYEAAAKQGMAEAQYNIATMYQSGEGVTKNNTTAYMYFLLATKNGFPQFAAKELEKLSAEMKPEDIKEATVRAQEFKPVVTTKQMVPVTSDR
ncbi:MAG: tetratricopeptide repeat protein [Parvibaculum sp.]|uniref:tetratricopeptide repeat protein n=1 Tax=Parvibaculum sp. TaxID=2024848 RepID=UPI00284341BA|nr:tetratricopeptide repeat protein [Parvibaculum sp.]MDR3498181.1 tetratricopeptide repeat protein [Parvibaculum sp.]